ncbi:MAM and LDL-receptor class A domain-containing protein 2-like [Nymphalis io]|uniref:MAM and LDL-receptor class A domain-containing protein 2-like n=1 Tax=Inachis io TaxID=171585 RepID=UPI00216AA2DC|nr:MAM and LDL-receptor class A domain-containing protein 2-like [Nymphalis io]
MFIQCVLFLFVFGSLNADYFRSTCSIPRLDHGRVKIRQRARLVQFICLQNYELIGNKYATCRDGEWDVPIPVCIRPGCTVPSIENGLHMSNFDDAWVIYFCLPGHKLEGSSVIYCDGRRWNATAPTCVDSTTVSALSCDFETPDICGWTQSELHDFDWRRLNMKTPSSFLMTGPSYDHTYGQGGSGYYMYIESTSRLENDTARLVSPVYESALSKNSCFSFFYHMYGNSSGGLRVYQKPDVLSLQTLISIKSDENKYILFEKWGNLGNFWFSAVVPLTELETNFQIVIEGIRGSSFTSDIAIDDVAILKGENCTIAKMAATTPPSFRSDSCENRCFLNDTFHAVGCGCTFDCVMEDNCCLDFLETCVFQLTPISDDMATDSRDAPPQTQKLIAAITETTSTSTSTSSTTTSTTTTTPRPTTTSTTTSTTSTTTPRITTAKTERTTRRPTTRRIITTKPTTKTTTRLTTGKPNVKSTTSKKITIKLPTTTTSTTTTVKPPTTSSVIENTTLVLSKTTEGTVPVFVEKEKKKTVIESRKFEHVQLKEEAHSSNAWKVILILVFVIAFVATVSWTVVVRSARGRVALAKFRGHVHANDPEVRYLSTDVDDD